uniref:Nuclear transcription factor Y subunit C-3 n=2 Tax=Anthurium amnicola TaxID=1678845 RepID=A0A1D1YAW6_9ARAE
MYLIYDSRKKLRKSESEMDETSQEQPNIAPHEPNQMLAINTPTSVGQATSAGQPTSFPVTLLQLTDEQLSYQRVYQQHLKHLQEQLQMFWDRQHREIEETTDFKNHNLPLARIKKIMKADEDVRMIASEALVLFARACEIFILELTLRAWSHTEENKRRTLQKSDIAVAITRTDVFDFLVDIVPRDEVKEGMFISVPGVGGSNDPVPYYYVPAAQVAPPGMVVGSPGEQALLYGQQPYIHVPHQEGLQVLEQQILQHQPPTSDT